MEEGRVDLKLKDASIPSLNFKDEKEYKIREWYR